LTSERRAVFGVRIAYQSTGEMISLVSFITDGKYLYNKKILSRREFSFFASGEWPSIYNQKRVNLFDKNNVLGGIYKDSISLKKMDYCFSIDSLWKIRYRLYPFQGKSEYGWSQESYAPSTRQKKYIFDRYNVDQIDGKFFMDTSFWKLLRDVRDPQWISTYKAI
jgi:hypothetical protein